MGLLRHPLMWPMYALCAVMASFIAIGQFRESAHPAPSDEVPPTTVQRPVQQTAPPATRGSGKAQSSLGTRPIDFGSRGQALALLALMEEQPGRVEYSVSYETTVDAVVVGADFNTGILARVHVRPDGKGSAERWRGYIRERLRAAAAGGSLNDTPAGKSFVEREDF